MANLHVKSKVDKFHGTEIFTMNHPLRVVDRIMLGNTSTFYITAFKDSKSPIEFIKIDLELFNYTGSNIGGGSIEFLLDDKTIIEVYSDGRSEKWSQTRFSGAVNGSISSTGHGHLDFINTKSDTINATTIHTEETGYFISIEDFKKICASKSISIRLHESEGGYIAEYSENKCRKLLSFFRIFYREAINNKLYQEEAVSQVTIGETIIYTIAACVLIPLLILLFSL